MLVALFKKIIPGWRDIFPGLRNHGMKHDLVLSGIQPQLNQIQQTIKPPPLLGDKRFFRGNQVSKALDENLRN